MSENDPEASSRDKWVSIWVTLILDKRKIIADTIASFPLDSAQTTQAEAFMSCFSSLQISMAEIFVREEEILRISRLPDGEERRHINEHNRMLDIFNEVYLDSMERKYSKSIDVFIRVIDEIEDHIDRHDLNVRRHLTNPQ